jgi:hypothetical protein
VALLIASRWLLFVVLRLGLEREPPRTLLARPHVRQEPQLRGRSARLPEGGDQGARDGNQVGDTRGHIEGRRRPLREQRLRPSPAPGKAAAPRFVLGERHCRVPHGVLQGDGQRGEIRDPMYG